MSPQGIIADAPRRVALVLDLHNHIHRGVVQGICRYVRLHGPWDFCTVQAHASAPWPDWAALRPDGIIGYAPTVSQARALACAGCATVNLGEVEDESVKSPSVVKDHREIGRLGVEHLSERGLPRLAFAWHRDLAYGRPMAEGFLRAVGSRGAHTIELGFPLTADWRWEQHREEIWTWLEPLPRRTGLMACNDYFARQLLGAAEALGRKVPEDLAILGVNDNPVECELSRVPLSSVTVSPERLGWEACRLLKAQWEGGLHDPGETVRVAPVGVATRASTDVFAVDDAPIRRALHELHAHQGRDVGVDALVKRSGLSRRRFEVRFRAAVGRSPYEEILRLRVGRARELLAQTDLKVEAIAHQCGFHEAKVFHHHFRKLTGCTPATFRQRVGFGSPAHDMVGGRTR